MTYKTLTPEAVRSRVAHIRHEFNTRPSDTAILLFHVDLLEYKLAQIERIIEGLNALGGRGYRKAIAKELCNAIGGKGGEKLLTVDPLDIHEGEPWNR